MERSEAYGFSAAISGAFLLSCLLFSALNREQRAPYMDEAFHVPQAQAYCEGLFQQWNPMITTLPGLYLMSVGIVKPAVWLFGWSRSVVCSTGMLRFINLLFSVGNFYLLYLLLCKIHHKNKAESHSSIPEIQIQQTDTLRKENKVIVCVRLEQVVSLFWLDYAHLKNVYSKGFEPYGRLIMC
nr:dol-P-Glc:Glc(2)Man(9)GlcNAc(2)-PP-Dol alpha-1,2-glucosyltransferase-like isoform X3 [Chelonoidis abingdonii]